MARVEPLSFKRVWTSETDFPTYEGREEVVRADMQFLFDAIKDYINSNLLDAVNVINAQDVTTSANATVQQELDDLRAADTQLASGIQSASAESARGDSQLQTRINSVYTTLLAKIRETTVGQLVAGSVGYTQLAAPAVKAENLFADAVTTPAILDGAVTSPKIPAGALLEDVTNDVTITCVSSHTFTNNLKFYYSRALGIVFVSGYATIAPASESVRDINAICTIAGYVPKADVYIPATGDFEDVAGTVVRFESVGEIYFESPAVPSWELFPSRAIHVNGFYLCDGNASSQTEVTANE